MGSGLTGLGIGALSEVVLGKTLAGSVLLPRLNAGNGLGVASPAGGGKLNVGTAGGVWVDASGVCDALSPA